MGDIDLNVEGALSIIDRGAFVGRGTKMGKLMETYADVQEGQTRIMRQNTYGMRIFGLGAGARSRCVMGESI